MKLIIKIQINCHEGRLCELGFKGIKGWTGLKARNSGSDRYAYG